LQFKTEETEQQYKKVGELNYFIMGSLSSIYLKKETLETLLKVADKKGLKGIDITVSISDDSKTFKGNQGDIFQNVSAYVSQSKEEREDKKDKFYVGNGKVFWTDGNICVAGADDSQSSSKKSSKKKQTDDEDDDLPF
jgi:hypothetical protein